MYESFLINNKKRVLAGFLAIILLLNFIPTGILKHEANAVSDYILQEGEAFTTDAENRQLFVYNYNTETITKYIGGNTGGTVFAIVDYILDGEIKTGAVRNIGDGAFMFDSQGSITTPIHT